MPVLEESQKDELDEEDATLEKGDGETPPLGELWEDEEAKSFYENLVDLKAIIPAILYKDSAAQPAAQDAKEKEKKPEKEKKGRADKKYLFSFFSVQKGFIIGTSSAESAARAAEAEVLGDDFEEELAMSLAEDVAPPSLDGMEKSRHFNRCCIIHRFFNLDDPEENESQSVSAKMQFDAFIARLPNCVSRDLIDTSAVDFCMGLNTKINRKKLVK